MTAIHGLTNEMETMWEKYKEQLKAVVLQVGPERLKGELQAKIEPNQVQMLFIN